MYREILVLPNGYRLYAYGTFLLLAFVVSSILAVRQSHRDMSVPRIRYDLPAYIYLGSLLGARLFHTLQYKSWTKLGEVMYLWRPGMVFYGGLIGGICIAMIYLKIRKMPVLATLDFGVPYLLTGEAIARTGCFLNGCCFGSPASLPWAVQFPKALTSIYLHQVKLGLIPRDAAATVPVHPFQLYMVAGLLGIIVILRLFYARKRPDGSVSSAYFLYYGGLRFAAEFFRGDSRQGFLHLTVSQQVSLILIALGLILSLWIWSRTRVRGPRPEAAP